MYPFTLNSIQLLDLKMSGSILRMNAVPKEKKGVKDKLLYKPHE